MIEHINARYVLVGCFPEPGTFGHNDWANDVAGIAITSFDGDGVFIEGRPEDLEQLAERIAQAATQIREATDASPALRALYGITSPEAGDSHG